MDAKTRRHNDLRRWRESRQKEGRPGVKRFVNEWRGMLKEARRNNTLDDWSIRGMFEAVVDDGHELVNNHFGSNSGGFRMHEAGTAIDTSLFQATQGQYVYNLIMEAYEKPEFVGDLLFRTQQSNEVRETIPGVSELGDDVEVVDENEPYPNAVTQECWIETPATIKRGLMVNVTKETVFFDKTGLIMQRASNVGYTIRLNKEKRMLDCAFGITTVYKRNGKAAEATYQSENLTASNPLVDFQSLDTADTKYSDILDPDTGEPIVSTPNTLIVPSALKNTAMRIRNSVLTNVSTQSSTVETRVAGNSLNQPYEIVTSPYVKQRTSSASTWFYGNPKAAFIYMQNWPLTVENETGNGPQAFERDIVARYKASERGSAGVYERRHMLKATA